ncbi:DgyrCDS5485 [Dimorphilus gyrociliatus]|uniref:[heparan sulfate]-glucosamine N-sulfotransferase n=1 Tax=Dimorphilus gyrociliatus TaxID=2664684 RepID=A0A7I8VLM9_9ANNE|nr:DgyrCDS5485 [Dimorphilus gyrociliatus]
MELRKLCQKVLFIIRKKLFKNFRLLIGLLAVFSILIGYWPPSPGDGCPSEKTYLKDDFRGWMENHSMNADNKVLLLAESSLSHEAISILNTLESWKIRVKMLAADKNIPTLAHRGRAKYSAIIFQKIKRYYLMDSWNRKLLETYCQDFSVGIIFFTPGNESFKNNIYGLQTQIVTPVYDYTLVKNPLLRISKHGAKIKKVPGNSWTAFTNTSFQTVATATTGKGENIKTWTVAAFEDRIIKKFYIGNSFSSFWVHRLLLMDALCYLSADRSLCTTLKRYVLIDVDDIFVGKQGSRLTEEDVEAMIKVQTVWNRDYLNNFKFNLGFSAYWYMEQGDSEEIKGDQLLIKVKDQFQWFPHMYKHTQPHKLNLSELENYMLLNKAWARKHNIKFDTFYSVPPHHSGVYPVHKELYESWKKIWNIQVTSTEEYPHLRPSKFRRGFIHSGIRVLPRQTCGLYTHTVKLFEYPGGFRRLLSSIAGGELFRTFVDNPVSIFMTHMSNYGRDRLALYTFTAVFDWLKCWTNLKFIQTSPINMANYYFNLFPEEIDPIWFDPCKDQRHFKIWSSKKSCGQLPDVIILGPQKTGTTALLTFLDLHKSIKVSKKSPNHFEETQFLSGKDYFNGLDFYRSYWPPQNNSDTLQIDKSSTYFHSELAPRRAYALVPSAKLIVLALEPGERAYSWYQHQRAHKDRTAETYTFDEVLEADETSMKSLRDLKKHCLNPGHYSQHIEKWLLFYPSSQLLLADGNELKRNPVKTLQIVQEFLDLETLDFAELLVYDPVKQFYCVRENNKKKCLGKSKGRKYEEMSQRARQFLNSYYKKHNANLVRLLKKISKELPSWLEALSQQNEDEEKIV